MPIEGVFETFMKYDYTGEGYIQASEMKEAIWKVTTLLPTDQDIQEFLDYFAATSRNVDRIGFLQFAGLNLFIFWNSYDMRFLFVFIYLFIYFFKKLTLL